MTTKTCPECEGHIDAVNKDCEACRSREQVRLRKKEQEKFIRSLDSKEMTDTLQADIRKIEKSDEDRIREFDKRFM